MSGPRCEFPFPSCAEPATALMSYHRGDGPVNENGTSTKALCSPHFREVETILWARGLTWHAEPMGVSRKILALRHRGAAEDLRNRGGHPAEEQS